MKRFIRLRSTFGPEINTSPVLEESSFGRLPCPFGGEPQGVELNPLHVEA